VEDALIAVQTYQTELDARFKQRESATSAKELSRERYDGGVTSYLEVLENDRSLFEAELNASEVQQLYLNSFVNLYKALGGGWISIEERRAAEDAAVQAAEENSNND
jgi:multidrug efflux system outer membrane protein